jgi:hypothetical protein
MTDLAAILLRLEVLERLVAHRLPTCDEPGCPDKPRPLSGLCRGHEEGVCGECSGCLTNSGYCQYAKEGKQ